MSAYDAICDRTRTYAEKPLLFRLSLGIRAEALTYSPQGRVAKAWKFIAQLGEIKHNRITRTVILCGVVFFIVSMLFLLLSFGYSCWCMS